MKWDTVKGAGMALHEWMLVAFWIVAVGVFMASLVRNCTTPERPCEQWGSGNMSDVCLKDRP